MFTRNEIVEVYDTSDPLLIMWRKAKVLAKRNDYYQVKLENEATAWFHRNNMKRI